MVRYNTNPTFRGPVQMPTVSNTDYSGKPVQMPTPTVPQNPNRKKPVQMPSPTVPDLYQDTTYSDWTPVQNPEAQTDAEGYGGEEAGDYNTYPAGYGYGSEGSLGVTVPTAQQPAGPEGYQRRMQVAPKRQGYAKGGYLKKFEEPAGKLKHDYDGYPVTDSTREGGYITTNLLPQNGEDYYTITEPDDLSANFYKEESKRNNIERLILHPADGYTSNDTIYSMPSGPTILKGSPVYQNYADQYNQDTPVSNSKKIITSLGNKVRKLAKRFLPWEQHGGRLPLLKRQGGRIINVYY